VPTPLERESATHGRWHGPAIAASVCALLVALGFVHWWQAIESFRNTSTYNFSAYDFRSFYAAGRLVTSARAHDLYTHGVVATSGRAGGEPYFNPPFFALFWAPFAALPFDAAYRVWTSINVALLAVNGWLLWRIGAALPRTWRAVLITAFITSAPVSHGIVLGQYSLLLTASWGSAYLFARNGRDRLAGVALTPLLIKPELLLPLAIFLAWRNRGIYATLLPITLALVSISIAIVGPAAAIDYPFYLIRESESQRIDAMFGWTGVIAGVFGSAHHAQITVAAAALGASTLAAAAFTLRRSPDALARSWLIVAIATVLSDLHLYFQDTAILAPMAIAYLAAVPPWRRARTAIAIAAGWCVLWFEPFMSAGVPINVIFGLFLVAALRSIPSERAPAEAAIDARTLAA
jgi:hypothetical protein